MPRWHLGVPVEWVDEGDLQTWPSLAGRGAAAIDPRDPPVFEAQASYLQRHGLLLPGEARRLNSADFQPEPVLQEPEPRASVFGLREWVGRVH